MPTATSFSQLQEMMKKELRAAMHETQDKVLNVMKQEVSSFYSMGNPKIYDRTGTLESSPRVTGVNGGGTYYEFEAYLDTGLGYLVPNPAFTSLGFASYFSTLEVYTAAENHTAGVLGRPGFWARSEAKFQQELDNSIRSHFG